MTSEPDVWNAWMLPAYVSKISIDKLKKQIGELILLKVTRSILLMPIKKVVLERKIPSEIDK